MQTYKLKHGMISLISLSYKLCEHSLLLVQFKAHTGEITESPPQSAAAYSILDDPSRQHICWCQWCYGSCANWKRDSFISHMYLPVQT